jgi:hypothetical protein
MLAALATVPIVVGLALWLSGATGRWVSRDRPFA